MRIAVLLLTGLLSSSLPAADDGEYLFNAAGCLGCHTAKDGPALAGGRAFETEFGTFYSPNITPDPDTGIGGWTREAFVQAVKHGRAPDGSAYFPVFPYPSYRRMTDEDAGRIYDYLQSVEPHRQVNRGHELRWWLGRWMMKPWQWWMLGDPPAGAVASDPQHQRGRYLVDALGHCGECHTPRNRFGVSDASQYLAGTREGPDGNPVPNVTQHRDDGIGKWSADDIAYFLEVGELPSGDYTGGPMAEVVDNSTSRLTTADLNAIAAWLKSLPATPGP